MNHFYLLNQEGSLFIVESENEMPIEMDFDLESIFKIRFKEWLSTATKYPIADKENEKLFIDFIGGYKHKTNEFNLTAGIKIKSENINIIRQRIKSENKGQQLNAIRVRSAAVYRPSLEPVKETQEEIWNHIEQIIDDDLSEGEGFHISKHAICKLESKFHITRINQ